MTIPAIAQDRGKSDRGRHQARYDDDEQAGSEEDLGILGPCCLSEEPGKQEPPSEQQTQRDCAAEQQSANQGPDLRAGSRRHRPEREHDRDQRHVFEQQHSERGAAYCGLGADHRQDDRRRR